MSTLKILPFIILAFSIGCNEKHDTYVDDIRSKKMPIIQSEANALELQKIKATALRSMVHLHADTHVDKYYVIEDSDLLMEFRDFFPKVVTNTNNRFGNVRGAFRELSTGENAQKWTIGDIKVGDNVAEVDVYWFSGSLAAGVYFVHLIRKESGWILDSYERGPTS